MRVLSINNGYIKLMRKRVFSIKFHSKEVTDIFLSNEQLLSLFQLYAEKVAQRGLCAIAQCESLRYKLIGGLAVRR